MICSSDQPAVVIRNQSQSMLKRRIFKSTTPTRFTAVYTNAISESNLELEKLSAILCFKNKLGREEMD